MLQPANCDQYRHHVVSKEHFLKYHIQPGQGSTVYKLTTAILANDRNQRKKNRKIPTVRADGRLLPRFLTQATQG
jgi:hypothetical protein